jgi:MYXO-CTERM domain-containing protein
MRIRFGVTAASLSLVICGIAAAGPLNLTQSDPDATSDELNIVYNATSQSFTATGLVSTYSTDYPALYNTSFSLTATIPNSVAVNTPTLLSVGTLDITASVGSPTAPVQTLYYGSSLQEFAFSDPSNGPSPLFDFIFTGTSGSLLTAGQSIGVEISSANTLAGFHPAFFTASFNNNSNTSAVSDAYNVAPVPEPAGFCLLGAAAAGLIRRRRI